MPKAAGTGSALLQVRLGRKHALRVLILAVRVTSAELGLTVVQTIEMDINYKIYSPLTHHLAAAILWFPYPGSVVTMGGRQTNHSLCNLYLESTDAQRQTTSIILCLTTTPHFSIESISDIISIIRVVSPYRTKTPSIHMRS